MKKISIITIFILIIVCDSCKKSFLIKPPLNEITAASFWKTETDALLSINAVYDALQIDRGYRLGTIMLGDVVADDMTCFDVNWYVKLDQFTFTAGEDQLLGSWRAWYSGISRANSVIKWVPGIEMDADLKTRIINEAKFLRGVCYFNIVNIWGDAPFITSELSNAELLQLKREPQASIWAQIEEDFTDAEELPLQYAGSDLGRATKGAAKAFLARTYLYQKKFQLAAAKAKEVIDLGIYNLHDEYIKNFQTAFENGKESVFEVQFVPGTGGWGNNEGNFIASWTSPGAVGYVPSGGWGIIIPEAKAIEPYEAGDKRREVNIFENGSIYNNIPYNPSWSPTGVNLAKYIIGDPPSDKEGMIDAERNMPVVRYSEVLIIYAEALNETDQTELALPYLNMIRTRAGLPPLGTGLSKDAFRDAVLQERRIEFFGEGHRFFDLRRMGKSNEFIKIKAGKLNYTEPKNLYFAIPQSEIDLNNNLEQNVGY